MWPLVVSKYKEMEQRNFLINTKYCEKYLHWSSKWNVKLLQRCVFSFEWLFNYSAEIRHDILKPKSTKTNTKGCSLIKCKIPVNKNCREGLGMENKCEVKPANVHCAKSRVKCYLANNKITYRKVGFLAAVKFHPSKTTGHIRGGWIGVCKSADPCYILALSLDPMLFSFKSGSALPKNFPWFKLAPDNAYGYMYLFSFSFDSIFILPEVFCLF